MNAKEELLNHIESIGSKDIEYIRIRYYPTYTQKIIIEGKLEEVIPQLNFDYDNNDGIQYIYGAIWFKDITWSVRKECNGFEWWKHIQRPKIACENCGTNCGSYTAEDCGANLTLWTPKE